MAAYTAAERKRLEGALAAGGTPACPACGAAVDVRDVPRPKAVSYVRRRVWILCPSCGRTGAVEKGGVRGGGRP